MIELEPDRHDELAALIAGHMEAGGETARSGALVRPRRPLGRQQPAAGRAAPLARGDASWPTSCEENEETAALAVISRLLQLDYAWRLGMDDEEEARLAARGGGDRRRGPATCTRWRC